jgi:hypothetical protein
MYFLTRIQYVCGVTEEWQPHVFYMGVIEALIERSVELVSCRVSNNWPSEIGGQPPHVPHAHPKLFSPCCTGDDITFFGI